MDIGKAFSFVFEEDRWIEKILIAAAIMLGGVVLGVLIIPAILAYLLLAGYGLEITRRVIQRTTPTLPEWDNWGAFLSDGLQVLVINIVYAIPIILTSICLGIPMGIAGEEAQEINSALSGLLGCLNFLWSIVLGVFLPAAIARFAVDGKLSSAFRFGEVFSLVRNHIKEYLVVLVMGWVASLVGGLGLLVCGVGWLVTAPYSTWITSHLYGQAYLVATGQPAAPAVPDLEAA